MNCPDFTQSRRSSIFTC